MRSKKDKKQYFEEPDEFPGEETQPYVFLYQWNEDSEPVVAKEEEQEREEPAAKPPAKDKSLFKRIVSGIFSF